MTPPPAAGSEPAWRRGQAVGEWRQICGTPPSSAPISVATYPALGGTGPASKIIAWCGLSIDPRDSTVYMPANGGHADYAGNEVNSIRLSDDAPRWIERRAATPVGQIVLDQSHYLDGRPTSGHSYFANHFIVARNRAMSFSRNMWGVGRLTRSVDGFNPVTNDWDPAGTYPMVPTANQFGAAVTRHPGTEDVYVLAGNSLHRWNQVSNTWTTITTTAPLSGYEAASAVDTQRNRILYVGGQAQGNPRIYNIGASTFSAVTLTGPNAANLASGDGIGMVYVPAIDAYLARRVAAGPTVYRINPQTFSVDTLPTTGGAGIATAINGVYTRFLHVPQFGGVVFSPDYESHLWFLRTD